MPYKLNQNASVRLSTLALFFISGLGDVAVAQPYLQSEQASLAVPQAPAKAANALPPLAPEREGQSPKRVDQASSNNWRDRNVFRCLDKMAIPGWSDHPMALHQTAPRQAGSNAKSSQSNPPTVPETAPAPTGEPSILDLVFEFGCAAYGQKIFAQGQRQIVASIYQFGTADGAYGAYCCLRKGASNLIPKGDVSSEDDQDISFWKDKYFVNISGSSPDDEDSKAMVTTIAQQLAASIPVSSAKPRILTQLPTLEKVLGSEKIVMGPLALKKLFPAPYIATLVTDADPVRGAVADYQVQEPYRERLKLLVLRFANPALTSLSFSKYVGQLEEQHDEQDLSGFTYQTSVFKVGGTFMLCQNRGDELVIITGSRKKLSLATLAKEIY